MRMGGARQSVNVEDRRRTGGRIALGGGLGTIVFIILAILFGADPLALLQQAPPEYMDGGASYSPVDPGAPLSDPQGKFISQVLADTEDVWNALFLEMGRQYEEPTLVLFRDYVDSACGMASSAVGPFYCPGDSRVYLDLGFFDELARRFQAPGDFAQAYVVAHEIGHHVQNLLGISDQVHARRGRVSDREFNELSVRLELQADFLAGVWAHHAHRMRQLLEEGDVEEGLRAASAIGDDTIQRRSQGRVVPDSFTHGTSAQRVQWFKKGLQTGDVSRGDTFGIDKP